MVKIKRLYKPITKSALKGADAIVRTDGVVSIEKVNDNTAGLTFYDTLTIFNKKCVPAKIDASNTYKNAVGNTLYRNYMRFWVAKCTPETLSPTHMYKIAGNRDDMYSGSTLDDVVKNVNYILEEGGQVYLVYDMNEDDFYETMIDWKVPLELMEWKAKKQLKGFKTVIPHKKSHRDDLACALSKNFRRMI